MSFKLIQNRFMGILDKDLSERYHRLCLFQKAIEGTLYDNLEYDYYSGMDDRNQYIPLRKRVPSVQAGLCQIIVNDSTSLLFSESHFPAVSCANKKSQIILGDIVENAGLQSVMLQLSRIGSIGSSALEILVIDNELIFNVLDSKTLTPQFDPKNPAKLIKVSQKYKISGKDLNESNMYAETFVEEEWYWFKAEWDIARYINYNPILANNEELFEENKELSIEHNLGFVPIVWMKNLLSMNPHAIDGAPTCDIPAIRISVELDYQLSQTGRALYFAADPKLAIKRGEGFIQEAENDLIGGVENLIELDAGGDAKLLEINGKSIHASLEYEKELRERFMELCRGNRTSPDKLAAATSGYAIELMNMALTNLVKELRVSYGNCGLIPILKMICEISKKVPFKLENKIYKNIKLDAPIRLKWPDFYEETESDRASKATTLSALITNSLIALEDGREEASTIYGISAQDAIDEEGIHQNSKKTYIPVMDDNTKTSNNRKSNESLPGKSNAPKIKNILDKKDISI